MKNFPNGGKRKDIKLNFLAYARKLSFLFLCFGVVFVLSGCGIKSDWEKPVSGDNGTRQTENLLGKNIPAKPVKILFVGDMMFDRYIRTAVEKYGYGDYNYIFSSLKNYLGQFDIVVANLEGPITGKKSTSVGTAENEKRNLVFTFDPAVAKTLFENNIKLVNLGNNHILNQGEEGLDETKKHLDEAGVGYFGDTGNGSREFLAREIGGVKIGFANYNYSAENSFDKVVRDIGEMKGKVDFVIVSPHWGTEYKTGEPAQSMRDMARRFIDAGADAVIGTHPHVVEVSEEYNGKKIYYSLGNFVFDQYFSPDTMNGLGVELTINPDQVLQYKEVKFVMNRKGQTELKSKN